MNGNSSKKFKLGDVSTSNFGSDRLSSRSVSWNANGLYLAVASSDRQTRLCTLEGSNIREVGTIYGHGAPVERVRFHASNDSLLCTAASDATVRLWDVRLGTGGVSSGGIQLPSQQVPLHTQTTPQLQLHSPAQPTQLQQQQSAVPLGQIHVQPQTSAIDVSWSPKVDSSLLVVTERNSSIHVYDTRKLSSSSSNAPTHSHGTTGSHKSSDTALLKTFSLKPSVVEACIFSPGEGRHLVAATTLNGVAEVTMWDWEQQQLPTKLLSAKDPHDNSATVATTTKFFRYPGHTGPIYSMCFSPDGTQLATGGSDAIVGLWDVATMVCTRTISRCLKFTRSVSYSHDSKFLATSSEDDGSIDLALAETGDLIGKIGLGRRTTAGGGVGGAGAAADEIAFHPKAYVLACASGGIMGGGSAAVTVAKLAITSVS